MSHDQGGVSEFRFRYVLRARAAGAESDDSLAWSRSVASPLVTVVGRIASNRLAGPPVVVDPRRAIATCLKPADDPKSAGVILQLREVAGRAGPLELGIPGYRRAFQTDLLERDLEELTVAGDRVEINLRAHGFAGLRLLR